MVKYLRNQAAYCMKHQRDSSMYASHEVSDRKKGDAKRNENMTRRQSEEDDRGDINELAEAFIKNFHNQLRIQREESFKHYHEKIARGA